MQANNIGQACTLSSGSIDIFAKGTPEKISVSEVLNKQGLGDSPVKVDISEEGFSAYKHMFQNNNQDEDFKSLNLKLMPGEMAWGNKDWPDIDEFIDWGTSGKMMNDKIPTGYYDAFVSVKEKAAALLKGYAETYDEIIKGYEAGTRVRYVVDMDTDALYRAATKEEELKYLKEEYASRVLVLEKMHKSDCRTREALATSSMDSFPYGSSLRNVLWYGTLYRNMKDEEKIVDIKQKLMDAASVFISQYKESGLNKLNLTVL